jgi:hypothetical protein
MDDIGTSGGMQVGAARRPRDHPPPLAIAAPPQAPFFTSRKPLGGLRFRPGGGLVHDGNLRHDGDR